MKFAYLLTPLLLGGSIMACSAVTSEKADAVSADAQSDRFAKVEIKTENINEGLSVLFGAGGNIAVSHGEDGTVLIDDQFAPLTDKITAAIADLDAEPVKFLINTHWHGDHTGGNENFGKKGALIMAHDNVRIRLADKNDGDGAQLPVVTYEQGVKLHLNGDVIDIVHMPHAHTDGDSVLFWQKANVVHMGDIYFNKVTLPYIDLSSGGSASGMLAAVESVLARIDDETVVIAGHGPISHKAELQQYANMLSTVIAVVEKAKAQGKSLSEIQAMKPAAQWDTNPDAFIKGNSFVEAVFNSMDAHH